MISFKIDPNTNDLILDGQNSFVMIGENDEDAEILQCIERILSTVLAEWFLNQDFGFDRFQLLGRKFDYDELVVFLNDAILQETRIDSIENIQYDFNRQTRKLEANVDLIKVGGERLEGVLNVNGFRV